MPEQNSAKIPFGLIGIIAILMLFSASILITQNSGNNEETTPLILTDEEAETLDIELPEGTPAIAYKSLLGQGDLAFGNRNFERALSYYIAAYQVNKDAISPFIKIIDVYLASENYPVALKNINLAEKKSANDPNLIVRQIRYHLAQNDIASALAAAEKATQVTESIALYKIVIDIMNDQHETAAKATEELVAATKDPKVKDTVNSIQKAYELFETFEEGNNAYRDTLLGQALLQIDETKLARDLFYRAIETNNDYRDAWIGLGYAFLQIKNYNQAEEALDRAKQIDPYKAETYFYQAIANEEQENYKRALGLLTQAKNYNYDNGIEIAEHLATNYYALQEYEKAITNYELVINAKKVPITYFVAPIWIHLEQTKDLGRALAIAVKAIEYYPNDAMSLNYLGWVQLYRGEFDEAKKNLTSAISKNPQLAAAYLNFGLLFKQQGKFDGAIPYFNKAADLGEKTKDYSIRDRAQKEAKLAEQLKDQKNSTSTSIPTNAATN